MAGKEEIYKRIKVAGMISYIPILLAAGPLGGFFLGDFLTKRFTLLPWVLFLCVGAGFLAGVMETIRIIRLVMKINAKS